MRKLTARTILITLLAFFVSSGVSYAVTSYLYSPASGGDLSPVATPPVGGGLNIDPGEPKVAACPLNGEMFTKTEQGVWESRRPLFIMIENSTDSRPQSGLGSADVVYEAVAEGGITRFGALLYCGSSAADTVVGPVRSARTYFVELASEYNFPLYTHVGGSNCSSPDGGKTCTTDKRVQALEQINSYGWGGRTGNDLNQFSIGFPTFWRDYERLGRTVATEHTMYSSTEKLYKYASGTRGWTHKSPDGKEWKSTFTAWKFRDEVPADKRGTTSTIAFGFWENYSDFDVTWKYDQASNTYARDNGGTSHQDLNSKEQLKSKVVVVQFTKELGPLDDHKHMFYEVIGTGEALIFQDGQVVKGTWAKKDRLSRTVFKDAKGKEIEFVRGPIWVEILPKGNTVTY